MEFNTAFSFVPRYILQFCYIFCLNYVGVQAQRPRNTKTSNGFICTFFVDSFSNFYTFHDAWPHTASISIFPTNACLIKLVGVGVQTSNSDLHK